MALKWGLYGFSLAFIISNFTPHTEIDPIIKPYDDEFLETVKQYCTEDKYLQPIQKMVRFGNLGIGTLAYCQTNSFTKMNIVYNEYYWAIQDAEDRYRIFTHEGVHCYFSEPHNEDPNHFMYEYDNHLSRQIVKQQLVEFLQKRCGKK